MVPLCTLFSNLYIIIGNWSDSMNIKVRRLHQTSWDARLRSGFGTMYGNVMVKILKRKILGFGTCTHAVNHIFDIHYRRARIIHSTDVTFWFKRIWGMMTGGIGCGEGCCFLRLHHEYHHCVSSVFVAVVFVLVSKH